MRIVNPRRFTIACIVFIMLIGLLGYGIYRGGIWVITMISAPFQQNRSMVTELVQEDLLVSNPVIVPVEVEEVVDPLVAELEWISRFVVGCETTLLLEDGIASLTFEVIPKMALNYYPRNEMTSRIYKQTLKLLRDISKMEHVSELKQLDILYLDNRFTSSENPVGEVMLLGFDKDAIANKDWNAASWLEIENYMSQ